MIEFNKHANVIYNDAGEKNVAAVVLHADIDNNNTLYWDKEFQHVIMPDELNDLFFKGLVLIMTSSDLNDAGSKFKPTSIAPAGPGGVAWCTVTHGEVNYRSGTPVEE